MIYEGSDLKFAIDIQCEGFSMDENDFTVDLVNGKKRISLSKEDLVQDSDGWYLCFNSGELGAGDIYVIVYAHVPDDDFADGERTEIYRQLLCHLEDMPDLKWSSIANAWVPSR